MIRAWMLWLEWVALNWFHYNFTISLLCTLRFWAKWMHWGLKSGQWGDSVHIKTPSRQAKSQSLYNIVLTMTSIYLHLWRALHAFKQRSRVRALSDILPCRHKDTLCSRQTLALFPVNRRPHLQPEQAWHAATAVLGVNPWDAVPCVLESAGPWQGFVSLMGLTSLSLHNTDEDKEATQCRSTSKAFPVQVSEHLRHHIHHHLENTERSKTAGVDTWFWGTLFFIIQLQTNKAV